MSLKTTFAASCTLVLIAAASAYAGGPGEFDTPQKTQHFNFYIEGMMPYATEESAFVGWKISPTASTITTQHINKKAGFGGTVGASYIFDNKSDLRAEYTYLPGKYKQETVSFFDPAFPGTKYTLEKTYQAVNLDMGQYWSPVQKLVLHFFAGIAYRNYKHEVKGDIPSNTSPYTEDLIGSGIESKFSGWGPRFGIDTRYSLFKWLNIVGNASLSLPYGGLEASSKTAIFADGLIAFAPGKLSTTALQKTETIDKFMPELAGNIGLQLNQQFSSTFWGGLELGYRVIHLMKSDMDVTALTSSGAAAGYKFDDTTFFGPYVRLSVLF